MKGTHVSKKAQKKLSRRKKSSDMSIPELVKLADAGDMSAKRELRRLCIGYA